MIRVATEEDAERLLEIYAPYVEETAVSFEYDVPSLEEFRGRVHNTLQQYPYLVVEEEGRILGYAYASRFHPREAYSHCVEVSIYLDMAERGQGRGRALYAEIEKILKKQNVHVIYSCIATTDRENDAHLTNASVFFHEKCGYKLIGKHEKCGYKFGAWYDMVWMEKRIEQDIEKPKKLIAFPDIR
ncbi:MAG: N-acetyltransferase family protein [Acetatifactor sp.]|nr:N-acetyltransferase family protein [Acetatifactor sp.]